MSTIIYKFLANEFRNEFRPKVSGNPRAVIQWWIMAGAKRSRRRWLQVVLAVVVFPFALAAEINDWVRRSWRR